MFKCLVTLYAFNFDVSNNKIRLVSKQSDVLEPISVNLSSDHSCLLDAVKELILDYLICSVNNINPRLFDVDLVNNIIKVNFVTTTPIDLKLANSYYTVIDNSSLCLNKTIQKALMYV